MAVSHADGARPLTGERLWQAQRQATVNRRAPAEIPLRVGDPAIYEGLRAEMAGQGCDGLLIARPDNFVYVTGAALPFAEEASDHLALAILPTKGEACVVCPPDWADAVADQGWDASLVSYDANSAGFPHSVVAALAPVLSAAGLLEGKIGLDYEGISKQLRDLLADRFPQAQRIPFDAALRGVRAVKTENEIALLETAANQSQKGFVSALNHVEGTVDLLSYTFAEFTERIRVHVGEFGGSSAGHIASMTGADAARYHVVPHGKLQEGNLIRMEATNHFRGYWSTAARTVSIGEPSEAQRLAYAENLQLKHAALGALASGKRCADVFAAVEHAAEAGDTWFWQEVGVGHSVGTAEREAPYLMASDDTILAAGMVMVVGVYTRGPEGELIVSKDTYEIQGGGCRLMSWYRNWDRLYTIYGFNARHG